ncbi:hypothetical protein PTT_09395 [Pyrenophora teres f. teres 0-1]|uniref:Uncharacterized protein n=1 Tax=Pyrenophora teres f. teres (strain 0-1) TaxID=861557 RepID=E3RLX3_PYRTT|nr:hypothetical protein PTT_09395 [Pyrenophora teres f. teres 0-1]
MEQESLTEDPQGMRPVTEWLRKVRLDKRPIPTENRYFVWGLSFLGKGPKGCIVVRDKDGLFVLLNNFAKELSEEILLEVIKLMKKHKYEERDAELVWEDQLRDARRQEGGLAVEAMSILPTSLKGD